MRIEIKDQYTAVKQYSEDEIKKEYQEMLREDDAHYDFDELLRFPKKGNVAVLSDEFDPDESDEPEVECTIQFDPDEEWAVVGWDAIYSSSIRDVTYKGLTNDVLTIIEVVNKNSGFKEYIMISDEPFKERIRIKGYKHVVRHN